MRRLVPLVTLLSLALAPPAVAKPVGRHIPLPDGWQPEGIAAGPGTSLYVGSIPTGAILRLDARTGRTRTVVRGRRGHAVNGVEADRRVLLAAGGRTGHIYAYDRRTGKELADLDVDGGFVNDVARARGAYYFTDSSKAVIYRVERDLRGASTIPTPAIPLTGTINLNGIERVGRWLVASHSSTGALWRINPVTGAARQIDLGGASLPGGDGLLRQGRRTLLVVQNADDRIAVVRLADDVALGHGPARDHVERLRRADDARAPGPAPLRGQRQLRDDGAAARPLLAHPPAPLGGGALDAGAQRPQPAVDVLVAAVDLLDRADLRLALRAQGGDQHRHPGPDVG